MVSMKRLLAQGISRLVVFGIMVIGVPTCLLVNLYYLLESIGVDRLVMGLILGPCSLLTVLLFLTILGLAVEE